MKNQKGSAGVWILIIIVILVVAGGIYFYSKNTSMPTITTSTTQTTATPVVPVTTTTETSVTSTTSSSPSDPEAAYKQIKTALDNATDFNDFYNLTLEYGSQREVSLINSQKAQIAALPQSYVTSMFATMKATVPTLAQITNISESINGNTATLSATSGSSIGTIVLVQENGVWKLDSESWKQ